MTETVRSKSHTASPKCRGERLTSESLLTVALYRADRREPFRVL